MNNSKKDQPYNSKLKGVAAFLGETTSESDNALKSAFWVEISSIKLPSSQPRRYFDPEKLEQLAQSVREHGILEPLLVRPLPSGEYELVAGERRHRAAISVGLAEVPVVVKELNDQEALQLALVENLVREDLNPIEETEGILQLLSLRLNLNVTDVISRLHRMRNEAKGKVTQSVLGNDDSDNIKATFDTLSTLSWESFVSSRLPLLKLPEEVLEALRSGRIEYTKATALARLKNCTERIALLEAVITLNLSLSQINERIKAALNVQAEPRSLKNRYKEVSLKLQKAKIWDVPKKQKALEKLLALLESLLTED